MARVCRHYEHQDFSGLLAELQGAGTEAEKPQPAPVKPKPVEKIVYVSPEARKRASLLSNPRMRYAYSQIDNTIHDRDCEALKTIRDKDFRMLADFDVNRPICKQCYRKSIIRSGIGDDAKHINAYVHLFDRLKATVADLKELIIDNGARLSAIDIDRVVIKVHDDRWMICFVNNKPLLYHNNYSVLDNYQRLFNVGYHVQNDGGIHTFHNFTRMMLSYSWSEHVEVLKAKALATLQAKIRSRLEGIPNWLRVPRFSLFNTYFTVVDCNHRLGRYLRKNGVPFIAVDKTYEAGSPYRLVTCRIRRWRKSKFMAAVDALKEYTVIAGYHDYADRCEHLFQDLSEHDQVRLQLNHANDAVSFTPAVKLPTT